MTSDGSFGVTPISASAVNASGFTHNIARDWELPESIDDILVLHTKYGEYRM